MKITGHVGIYKVKESFMYFGVLIDKDEWVVCGIVADPRVQGQIWKGWHLDKDWCKSFNNRNNILNPGYFSPFHRNQKYLDWTKLERIKT